VGSRVYYISSFGKGRVGCDLDRGFCGEILDSAARYFMNNVDMVLFGADTVTMDGSVVNKIGTSQIAVVANEFNVPVHVCAESYKFSKNALSGKDIIIEERDTAEIIEPSEVPGVKISNPVFDVTKIDYIRSIITEFGEIPPMEIDSIIQRLH
jgi:ribose 1,5-bisphosphate isomerase